MSTRRTSNGMHTYTGDARNDLVSMTGSVSVGLPRMRPTALNAVLVCVMVLAPCPPPGAGQESPPPIYYELYSWKDSKTGEWNFSLLYNTNRNKTVKEVFNKRRVLRGVDNLKVRLSVIPRGSHVVWFDQLTFNGAKAKGSEALAYPPEGIVNEVRRYARSRNIEVVAPLASPAPEVRDRHGPP